MQALVEHQLDCCCFAQLPLYFRKTIMLFCRYIAMPLDDVALTPEHIPGLLMFEQYVRVDNGFCLSGVADPCERSV